MGSNKKSSKTSQSRYEALMKTAPEHPGVVTNFYNLKYKGQGTYTKDYRNMTKEERLPFLTPWRKELKEFREDVLKWEKKVSKTEFAERYLEDQLNEKLEQKRKAQEKALKRAHDTLRSTGSSDMNAVYVTFPPDTRMKIFGAGPDYKAFLQQVKDVNKGTLAAVRHLLDPDGDVVVMDEAPLGDNKRTRVDQPAGPPKKKKKTKKVAKKKKAAAAPKKKKAAAPKKTKKAPKKKAPKKKKKKKKVVVEETPESDDSDDEASDQEEEKEEQPTLADYDSDDSDVDADKVLDLEEPNAHDQRFQDDNIHMMEEGEEGEYPDNLPAHEDLLPDETDSDETDDEDVV